MRLVGPAAAVVVRIFSIICRCVSASCATVRLSEETTETSEASRGEEGDSSTAEPFEELDCAGEASDSLSEESCEVTRSS